MGNNTRDVSIKVGHSNRGVHLEVPTQRVSTVFAIKTAREIGQALIKHAEELEREMVEKLNTPPAETIDPTVQ